MLPNLGPSSRNWRFPNIGTDASQSWNHGLPVLGTGSSHWFQVLGTTVFQTFEPMLSNLGTVCLQFQELLVPKIGINASDARNCKFPVLGISDSEMLERML